MRVNIFCVLSGIIQPGEVVRVWAGNPSDPDFKCVFGKNVWNNIESDPAVLNNSQSQEVSRY